MSTVYQKIPNCFLLDRKSKKYTGDYASRYLDYLKNCDWIFTEKIDGQGIRIIWDGFKVQYDGREDNSSIQADVRRFMDELIKTLEPYFEEIFREKPCVVYGEVYGGTVQNGNKRYSPTVKLAVFDVRVGLFWLSWDNVKDVASKLNLETVPYVLTGTIQQGIDWLAENKESLLPGSERLNEGLVGKPAMTLLDNQGERITVKLKQKHLT